MFEWIFYPWMISNVYMLLIIYARVDLTPIYIYIMLVLFTDCWGSNLSIQAGVGKLNGDLLQPSGIRYKFWSFSVICLVSLTYRKGLISTVTLSVVVPQAIGSFLCNRIGDHTQDFFWGFYRHSMFLNCSYLSISESSLGACFPSNVWYIEIRIPSYVISCIIWYNREME